MKTGNEIIWQIHILVSIKTERKRKAMHNLEEQLCQVQKAVVAGHVKPDGDCVGSCLAVYNYLKDYHPQMEVKLFLEPIPNIFKFLSRSNEINEIGEKTDHAVYQEEFDLMIVLDCGDARRLGAASKFLEKSKRVICIDHHISNEGFGDDSYIFPDASSTSELVFGLLEKEKITKQIAECIYVGIVHDTGIFQYSCTSSKTMRIAGFLMDTGIDFSSIVDKTYVEKTYEQNQILASAIQKSKLYLDGRCISSIITKQDMDACGALPKHLEGIVSHLRSTKGVIAAILFYPKDSGGYKISMRTSTDVVNAAQIMMKFGGGGHIRAAGASTNQPPEQCLDMILEQIKEQLELSQQAGVV